MSNQKFEDGELMAGETLRQSDQLKDAAEIQTLAEAYRTANPSYKGNIYVLENGDVFTDKVNAIDAARSWGVKLYELGYNYSTVKDMRIQITAVKEGTLQTFLV
jgi:hypothetical protein